MNENEIERIAAMASALRPDWPLASLRTLLAKPELARRTRRDVAVALTWVACESATKTPARVLEAGPWWAATNAEGTPTAMRHPSKDEACATCGRRDRDHIGQWLGDHPFTPLTHTKRGRVPAPDDLRKFAAADGSGTTTTRALPRPTPTEPTEESK